MPSTFCFTHPPHFLYFFPLTYGLVAVIDFDLLIVLFSLFARLLVWLSADRLLSAPSDLSQFVLLLLLFLFMLFLMPCAWKSFYFSPRLLFVCLLMHCWVPPPQVVLLLLLLLLLFLSAITLLWFFMLLLMLCAWNGFIFSLDVVWLSANGLLSALSHLSQASKLKCTMFQFILFNKAH